jgi:heme/copper-type cytochrome/quinol oxidase subunit 2
LTVTLAYTASAWTQVIVAISIFLPVVVALAIAIAVLRGKKNDPDEQRLRRVQAEYEARRDAERQL